MKVSNTANTSRYTAVYLQHIVIIMLAWISAVHALHLTWSFRVNGIHVF